MICDEAHRTTGVTLAGEDESNFVRIHDNAYLERRQAAVHDGHPADLRPGGQAQGRGALTRCWPRWTTSYVSARSSTARLRDAVEHGLLTDYKVLVLTVDEEVIAGPLQQQLADSNGEINLDDASEDRRLLERPGQAAGRRPWTATASRPARYRCSARSPSLRTSRASKQVAGAFAQVIDAYEQHAAPGMTPHWRAQVTHVDGTFNALRTQRPAGLAEGTCRPTANAASCPTPAACPRASTCPPWTRCCSCTPRNSLVDVVQSVGRVMRLSPGQGLRLHHPARRRPRRHRPRRRRSPTTSGSRSSGRSSSAPLPRRPLRRHDQQHRAQQGPDSPARKAMTSSSAATSAPRWRPHETRRQHRATEPRGRSCHQLALFCLTAVAGRDLRPHRREGRHPRLLGGLGRRRRRHRRCPASPASTPCSTAPTTPTSARAFDRSSTGSARQPQRRDHRRRRDRHARPAPDHQAGLRRPVRRLRLRRAQPGLAGHAGDARHARRPGLEAETETLEDFYASVRVRAEGVDKRRRQAADHHRAVREVLQDSPSRSRPTRLASSTRRSRSSTSSSAPPTTCCRAEFGRA